MSHLDEGTLHSLLDGELETHEVAEIQAHLGSCSACGLRLREVREFLRRGGPVDRVHRSAGAGDGGVAPDADPLGARTGSHPPRAGGAPRAPAPAAGARRSQQMGAME